MSRLQQDTRYLKILKTQLTEIPVHLYFSSASVLLTSPPKMENNQNAKSVCGPLHSQTDGWYNRTAPLTFMKNGDACPKHLGSSLILLLPRNWTMQFWVNYPNTLPGYILDFISLKLKCKSFFDFLEVYIIQ